MVTDQICNNCLWLLTILYLLNYTIKGFTPTSYKASRMQGFSTTPLPNQFLFCCINMSMITFVHWNSQFHKWNDYVKELNFVGLPGLEPRTQGPKSCVLPLHHSPICKSGDILLYCPLTVWILAIHVVGHVDAMIFKFPWKLSIPQYSTFSLLQIVLLIPPETIGWLRCGWDSNPKLTICGFISLFQRSNK